MTKHSARPIVIGSWIGYAMVVRRIGPHKKDVDYEMLCLCGNIFIKNGGQIRSAMKIPKSSCGCMNRFIHGLSRHPLYQIWKNMINRCEDVHNKSYIDYGGRGIKVCEEWRNSVAKFIEDMEAGYGSKLEIDRINNNLGYFKNNCRWVTKQINAQNKRNTIKLEDLL